MSNRVQKLLDSYLTINLQKWDDAGSVGLDFPHWQVAILVHGNSDNPEEGNKIAKELAEELAKRWNTVYNTKSQTKENEDMKEIPQPQVTQASAELAQLLVLKKQAKKQLKELERAIEDIIEKALKG